LSQPSRSQSFTTSWVPVLQAAQRRMLKRRRSSSFNYPPLKYSRPVMRAYRRRPSRNTPATVRRTELLPLRPRDTPEYKMHQFHSTSAIAQTAGADVIGNFSMVLTGMNNLAAWQALFDKYRVDYLEWTFRPRFTDTQSTLTPAAFTPSRIYVAVDKDGGFAVTTGGVREYQTCQTHLYEDFTVRIKPGVQTGAYTGAAIVPATNTISPWIDMAQTGIQHYGCVYAITAAAGGQTNLQTWDVDLYVGLTFKSVR